VSDLGPGYYWAIFRADPKHEPQIVKLIDMAGPTVLVMGRDNTLEPEEFEWLGACDPPPAY
jgi:hypothetical protein